MTRTLSAPGASDTQAVTAQTTSEAIVARIDGTALEPGGGIGTSSPIVIWLAAEQWDSAIGLRPGLYQAQDAKLCLQLFERTPRQDRGVLSLVRRVRRKFVRPSTAAHERQEGTLV